MSIRTKRYASEDWVREQLSNASGSASGNADWAQNDETAAGYIKNRPFYETTENVIVTEGTATSILDFSNRDNWLMDENSDKIYCTDCELSAAEYVLGEEYVIEINGEKYNMTFGQQYHNMYSSYAYGFNFYSESANQYTCNSEFPFFLIGFSKTATALEVYLPENTSFPVAIKVYKEKAVIKQIDPKYIKDMYYTSEPVETEIVPETPVEFSGEPIIDPFTLEFSEGEIYCVTWNGTRYDCIAYMSDVGGLAIGSAAIGNAGTGGNDEPFFCILYSGHVLLFAAETGTYTISISKIEQEIHHIPTKYVKDMYYDNGIILTESIPSQTISGFAIMEDPIYAVENPFPLTLTVGDTYLVNWDGTEYELVCETADGMSFIGNENYLFMESGGDIPFTVLTDGGMVFVATELTEESHTISITEIKHDIKQLNEKYLPILEEKVETVFEMDSVVNGNDYEDPAYKKIVGRCLVTIDDNSPKEVKFFDNSNASIVLSDFIHIMSEDGLIHIEFPDEESHYVKIEKIKNVIKTEYLAQPEAQSDWNQSDKDAVGYIKNRPFYDIPLSTIYEAEVELNYSEQNGYCQTYLISDFDYNVLEAGQTYIVTINDEYSAECVAVMTERYDIIIIFNDTPFNEDETRSIDINLSTSSNEVYFNLWHFFNADAMTMCVIKIQKKRKCQAARPKIYS